MSEKVTVILTSYNKPQSVGKSIESVLDQSFEDWELFIMDDGSNADTQNVIASYLEDSRIHYHNSGISDSDRFKTTRYATLINEAIEKSSGMYVTYLTDDSFYFPDRLSEMVTYLKEHPKAEVVYSNQEVRVMNQHYKTNSQFIRKTRGVIRDPQNTVDHCSVMHTRSLAEKVKKEYGSYWDDHPQYWHNGDAAFWARLAAFVDFYPLPQTLDATVKTPGSFQRLNQYLPHHLPTGTLIKGLRDDIYMVDHEKRRQIEREAFEALKYRMEDVVEVPDPTLYKYLEGIPVTRQSLGEAALFPTNRFVTTKKRSTIYYIEGNQKRQVVNRKVWKKFRIQEKEILLVSERVLNEFQTGEPIFPIISAKNLVPNGFVFKYETNLYISDNHQLLLIPPRVAQKLKLSKRVPIELARSEFASIPKGQPLEWKLSMLMP
ncbi:glycosyltransferase family 2 protein [Priestia koreensis]|uniref:glycosyltransferase family 2 protein n=1 Tax=Priestia koreensis TaxID=284581 RepID=UPI00301B4B05